MVLRLVNLESGDLVADASFENPQRFGGSDVMSRIHYDTTHPGKLLRRTLAGYLSHAIEELPADPRSIYEVVVVGNSTMRDLFFRKDVHSIGQHPYRSITEIGVARRQSRVDERSATRAAGVCCPCTRAARVYGGPIVSGHVGADAAAAMLAVGLDTEDRLVAIMDIGTNTELIVGNRHRIVAASCPAGPAFEGGAISVRHAGLDGAIEDVTIWMTPARGTGCHWRRSASGHLRIWPGRSRSANCGGRDRMNDIGRFTDGSARFDARRRPRHYVHEADTTNWRRPRARTWRASTWSRPPRDRLDDIDVFYLAGGFGRHMKSEAAKRIGLIPESAEHRIVRLGTRPSRAPVPCCCRSPSGCYSRTRCAVEHCRLEAHPRFFDFFVVRLPVRANGRGGSRDDHGFDPSPTPTSSKPNTCGCSGFHAVTRSTAGRASWPTRPAPGIARTDARG